MGTITGNCRRRDTRLTSRERVWKKRSVETFVISNFRKEKIRPCIRVSALLFRYATKSAARKKHSLCVDIYISQGTRERCNFTRRWLSRLRHPIFLRRALGKFLSRAQLRTPRKKKRDGMRDGVELLRCLKRNGLNAKKRKSPSLASGNKKILYSLAMTLSRVSWFTRADIYRARSATAFCTREVTPRALMFAEHDKGRHETHRARIINFALPGDLESLLDTEE